MGHQQQRAGVGRQGLGEGLPGVNIQMVCGLVQKEQVGPLEQNLGEPQPGQLAAREGVAGLKDRLAPEAQFRQMAPDFQLGHPGVFVPEGVDDPALPCPALLLDKDAGPRPGAEADHAAGGAALAVQYLHQGGFARAVGPGDDQPLAPADGVAEGGQKLPGAQPDGEVFHDDQLVPGLHVVLEPELDFVGLVHRGLGDLQLFQLFAAALGHLGGGGPDQVPVDVILELFGQGHVGVVLLLA